MTDRNVRVRVSADVSNFNSKLASASAAARTFANDLESSDSRMANLVQTGLALGPALVPIGAVAVPAIAGLTAGLGAAAVGAGVAVLAFQGIGDSLKALNDFQVEPSVENYEKLRLALEEIGPAGQDFVTYLNDLGPILDDLQNTAQAGLFPGLVDGIDEALNQLPKLTNIVESFSTSLGRLFSDAGDRLNDPAWDNFLDFVAVDGPPAMEAFARSIGNIAEGLAGMVQAADPLSDDFLDGLVNATEDFARWSRELGETDGFADFLDYIRDTGPQVGETLGALGSALLALLEATADIGPGVLVAVEALADAFTAVASSDIGPVLLGAAVGLAAVSRAIALLNAANASSAMSLLSKLPISLAAIANTPAAAKAALAGITTELFDFSEKAPEASKAATSLSSSLGNLGRLTSGVAGLALAFADFDDSLAFDNALTLGLLGGAFGPLGAGLGVFAGAVVDTAKANDDLVESLERARTVLDDQPLAFESQTAALAESQAAYEDFAAQAAAPIRLFSDAKDGTASLTGMAEALVFAKNSIEGFTGQSDLEESADEMAALEERALALRTAMADIARATTGQKIGTDNFGALQIAADNLAPSLANVGVQLDDFVKSQADLDQAGSLFDSLGDVSLAGTVASLAAFNRQQDSVAGRTGSVVDAVGALDDAMLSTADSASELAAALDALISPKLNLSEATDAYVESLRTLSSELNQSNNTLEGQSAAARQNRDAIRTRATALLDLVKAEADANAGSKRLTNVLTDGVGKLIDTGKAAGLAGGEVRAFVKELGLTPKLVKTLIEANTNDAERGIQRTQEQLDALNDDRSAVEVIANTNRALNALRDVGDVLGDLDGDDAKVDVKAAVDSAVNAIRDVGRVLGALDGDDATVKANADVRSAINAIQDVGRVLGGLDGDQANVSVSAAVSSAINGIEAVGRALGALDGRSAQTSVTNTVTNITKNITKFGGSITNADGNLVDYYARGGVRESHVAQIAPAGAMRIWAEPETGGEAYIPLHPSKRGRSRSIADETVARLGGVVQWLADGGIAQTARTSSPGPAIVVQQTGALSGRLTITNWQTGEARFEAVADRRIDERQAHLDTMARHGR